HEWSVLGWSAETSTGIPLCPTTLLQIVLQRVWNTDGGTSQESGRRLRLEGFAGCSRGGGSDVGQGGVCWAVREPARVYDETDHFQMERSAPSRDRGGRVFPGRSPCNR